MQLLRDATRVREAAKSLDGSINIRLFAELLACRGYFAWLRTGRVDNSQRVKALRHTFVVVSLPGACMANVAIWRRWVSDSITMPLPAGVV